MTDIVRFPLTINPSFLFCPHRMNIVFRVQGFEVLIEVLTIFITILKTNDWRSVCTHVPQDL